MPLSLEVCCCEGLRCHANCPSTRGQREWERCHASATDFWKAARVGTDPAEETSENPAPLPSRIPEVRRTWRHQVPSRCYTAGWWSQALSRGALGFTWGELVIHVGLVLVQSPEPGHPLHSCSRNCHVKMGPWLLLPSQEYPESGRLISKRLVLC